MTLKILHYVLLFCLLIKITNAAVITKEEFIKSVTSNRYLRPRDDVYINFSNHTSNFTREEVAMFIAQLIHESGGFKFTEQLECQKGDHCAGDYDDGVGLPNKSYYGRGYIQLTWAANYKVASQGLGMGDKLLKHPEIVANNKNIAMSVSVWYWGNRVRPLLKNKENLFGLTTKGINPGECLKNSKFSELLAKRRYKIYLKVAEVLKIKSKAKENGCYN